MVNIFKTILIFMFFYQTNEVKAMENCSVVLNSGYTMPCLGLGTWTLGNETVASVVYEAVKMGYRLFDTAQYYGNEKGVGLGLKKAIEDGLVKREELFITSKVIPTPNNIEESIAKSNDIIGLDYIDLMLIHYRSVADKDIYRALENSVKKGIVHSIGLSNYYTLAAVDEVVENAAIKPAVVQNENHIWYQNKGLQSDLQKYGTIIEAYYPLGGRGNTKESLNNNVIKGIAEKHGRTTAQIILRWQIQAGYIAIVGTSSEQHLKENFNIFDFALSPQEMLAISKLNKQNRYERW